MEDGSNRFVKNIDAVDDDNNNDEDDEDILESALLIFSRRASI